MGKGTPDNNGAFLNLEELQRVIKRAKHKAYARNRQQREIEEQAFHELAKQAVCAKIQEEQRENVRLRHNAIALQMQQIQLAYDKNTIEQMVSEQERQAQELLEQLRKAVQQYVRSKSEASSPSSSAEAHSRRAPAHARSRGCSDVVAPSPPKRITETSSASLRPRGRASRPTASVANVPIKRESTTANTHSSGSAAKTDAVQCDKGDLQRARRSPSPPSAPRLSPSSAPRDSLSPTLCSGSGASWSAPSEGGIASSSDAHPGWTLPGWPPLSLEGAHSFSAWAQPHPSETEDLRSAGWRMTRD